MMRGAELRPPRTGQPIAWPGTDGRAAITFAIVRVFHQAARGVWRVSYLDPGLGDRERGTLVVPDVNDLGYTWIAVPDARAGIAHLQATGLLQ